MFSNNTIKHSHSNPIHLYTFVYIHVFLFQKADKLFQYRIVGLKSLAINIKIKQIHSLTNTFHAALYLTIPSTTKCTSFSVCSF